MATGSANPIPLISQRVPVSANGPQRAQIAPLSAERTAVFYTGMDPRATGPRARLSFTMQDEPVCTPLVATCLDLLDGRQRTVFLVRIGADRLCRKGLFIHQAKKIVARVEPLALQSPVVDPLALLAGLAPSGALRLLKVFLTTGPSLFGAGSLDGFDRLIIQLLAGHSGPELPLVAQRAVGKRACVATYRTGPTGSCLPFRDLVLVDGGRARRLRGFQQLPADPGARRLDLLLPLVPPVGSVLVGLGDGPVRLQGPTQDCVLRPLTSWFRRSPTESRGLVLDWLEKLAPDDEIAAAQHRELCSGPEQHPKLRLHYAASTGAGLLYVIGSFDPHGLLAAARVTIEDKGRAFPLAPTVPQAELGALSVGYLPLAALGSGGGTLRLEAVTRSGRILPMGGHPILSFDGAAPPLLTGINDPCVVGAYVAALSDALARRPACTPRFFNIGEFLTPPSLSVVVGMGSNFDHLRAVLAGLSAEKAAATAEMIVHTDADLPTGWLFARLAELHAPAGIPLRLAVVAPGTQPAERQRAILAACRGPVMILLDRDTLIMTPDWVARWSRKLIAARGPRLLGAEIRSAAGASVAGVSGSGAGRPSGMFTAACCGLNRRAAAQLIAMPLRVTTSDGDLARLAASLGRRSALVDPIVQAVQFASPCAIHPLLCAAEAVIARSEGAGKDVNPL